MLEDCPPHSSSTLLGEGYSSARNQCHCLYLRKNLLGSPGWWWSWILGFIGGRRPWLWLDLLCQLQSLCSALRVARARLATVPGNSGMSEVSGRGGIFEMGWCYAFGVCLSMSGDGNIRQPKGNASHCSGWMRSMMCTFCNCCCSWLQWDWMCDCDQLKCLPCLCLYWVDCDPSLWVLVYHGLGQDLFWWLGVPEGGILLGQSCAKVAKFIPAVTLHIRAVGAKMACLSTNNASIIVRHHADHGGCQLGCYLLCCIEFLNYSNDFRWSLRVLFVNLSCGGVYISKSLNKHADDYSVIVKSASPRCCLKEWT